MLARWKVNLRWPSTGCRQIQTTQCNSLVLILMKMPMVLQQTMSYWIFQGLLKTFMPWRFRYFLHARGFDLCSSSKRYLCIIHTFFLDDEQYLLWLLAVTCCCCPYLYFGSAIMLVTYFVNLGSWMTTYLGKSCSFGFPRVPFINCRQFMY